MEQLNPACVLAPLHELLTNCQTNVLIGLGLVERIQELPSPMAEELSFFQISFALRPTAPAESKTLFKRWLLLNGLGDIQKAIRVSLERLLVFKSIEKSLASRSEPSSQGSEIEFHARASKLNLPDLLANLTILCGEPLQLQDHLTSLNNARNCLEHDNGIVTSKRCNNPAKDRLAIGGRRFKMFFKKDDNETPATLGKPGPENAALMLGPEDFVVEFALNQAIDLSLKEFIDILNTCIFFRADLETKLSKGTAEANSPASS